MVKRTPFTIRLLWNCEENVQPITLGIDSGYKKIGFSAVSDKKELICGIVNLRYDIVKLISKRRQYRRTRRSNKLWYRKPRFLNRKRNNGWLAPSSHHKLDSHLKLINKVKEILPIDHIAIEVASFDIQKINNPEIDGKEYQNGVQKGFLNVREYILHRDNHLCQYCKGKSKDKILQVHHIRSKKEGATDRPEELITVCKTCHEKHHKGVINIPIKPIKTFKPETFMTTVRWKLVNKLSEDNEISHTYGYKTKYDRAKLGLEKSHVNDAFVIAGGTNQTRSIPFIATQTRRNNRCLQLNRKGFKPSIRIQRYKFQPNDLVLFDSNVYRVKGVFNHGTWVRLSDIHNNTINSNIQNIKLITYGKGLQFKQKGNSSPT